MDMHIATTPVEMAVFRLHMIETKVRIAAGKKITVTDYPTSKPLGTVDGITWTLNQDLPDNDEDGLHGRNAR